MKLDADELQYLLDALSNREAKVLELKLSFESEKALKWFDRHLEWARGVREKVMSQIERQP